MAGASLEECQHLHLADKTQYHYLSQRASTSACTNSVCDNNANCFGQPKLSVQLPTLESTLAYKTKLIRKELCTIFLDPNGASDSRDDLAKTLYSLLFAWLNEHINQCLYCNSFDAFIGLFDLPGPQNMTSCTNSLDQFCIDFANKRLQNFIQKCIFKSHIDKYQTEGIS